MGKAATCIRMLELLYAKPLIKSEELAQILEINKRNIYEYRKELEEAGYIINSTPGKYGGYSLDRKHIFPTLRFTLEELNEYLAGVAYLNARNDYARRNEWLKVTAKINASITNVNSLEEQPIVINRFPLKMPLEELHERYTTLQHAISFKHVVQVEYVSLKNRMKMHHLHPYQLFMYNNAWFVIAWNESVNEITTFKLNRMKSIEVLNRQFSVFKGFDANQYIDQYGMKNFGDYYPIDLMVKDSAMTLINERWIGRNQIEFPQEDGWVKVSVEMQGKDQIRSFVLGMGNQCRVIAPQWLKDEIIVEGQSLLQYYQGGKL